MRGADLKRVYVVRIDEQIQEYGDGDLPLIIGGADDAHIPLQQSSGQAAYLAESRGHLFLQPASPALDVYHNDVRLSGSVWVKSGDIITIGPERIRIQAGRNRVEIQVGRELQQGSPAEDLSPPLELQGGEPNHGKPLPRITVPAESPAGGKFKYLAVGLALLMLSLSALFVLKATSIEIQVTPLPEALKVQGFPPVIAVGDRLLALEGSYSVKANLEGYHTLEENITVAPSTSPVYVFSMEKLPGRVLILTRPEDEVAVVLDDDLIGTTPLPAVEVTAGNHGLVLRRDRYFDLETEVEVAGMGEEQEFTFTLQPAWAEISLISEPAGAEVLVEGKVAGRTPLEIELLQDDHDLVLRKKDYADYKLPVSVQAGVAQRIGPVALIPATARVALTSKPPGAALTVDGSYKGKTPLTLELTPGEEHALTMSLPGYAMASQTVIFSPNEKASLNIPLEPVYGTVFVASQPVDALIKVNGKPSGKATGRLRLQADVTHELTVYRKGYATAKKEIIPRSGHSQQVDIRLRPEGAVRKQVTSNSAPTPRQLFTAPVTLKMGAPRSQPGRRANETQRTVHLNRPVFLGKTEVTNREFRRFKPGHRSGMAGGRTLDSDPQPVVNVTWEDAARYCNWLSEKEGLPLFYTERGETMVPAEPFNTGYRLPSEAEWAYGARQAGRTALAKYPWEGPFPPRVKSGNYGDESAAGLVAVIIRGYNDGFMVTAPVKRFPANSGGLFDMGGNVAEWCHDYYTPYAGFSTKPVTDPLGPATGSHHVVRGAGWRDASISELRLSYRQYSRVARDDVGFRLARYLR